MMADLVAPSRCDADPHRPDSKAERYPESAIAPEKGRQLMLGECARNRVRPC
jgi:hypothetical protein